MTEERLKQIEHLTGMLEPGNGWREDIRELVAEVRRLREEINAAPILYSKAPFRLKPIPDLIERVDAGLGGKSCLWAVDRQPSDTHQARIVRVEPLVRA